MKAYNILTIPHLNIGKCEMIAPSSEVAIERFRAKHPQVVTVYAHEIEEPEGMTDAWLTLMNKEA